MHHPITDTHIHIIPNVDDGADDMRMALRMLKSSADQGVRRTFATPHNVAFDYGADYCYKAIKYLERQAQRNHIPMELYMGCEIFCEPSQMGHILDQLDNDVYPTMNGTNYVLIEFNPYKATFPEVYYCVERLRSARYIPIFAHVERYADTFGDRMHLDYFKSIGCKMQVNLYSFVEEEFEPVRSVAQALLEYKMIDFIGTDAHKTYIRPPMVENGVYYILEHTDWEYARKILVENAQEMLIKNKRKKYRYED